MFTHDLGGGLELRLLEHRHAPELLEAVRANAAQLDRFLNIARELHDLERARQRIQVALDRFAAGHGLEAGIWFEGHLIGTVALHGGGRTRIEVGYWLTEPFQGRGIATRAAAAVTDHAFGGLGLHRVEMRCAVDNVRSRAVPERLGFRLEGILRGSYQVGDRFIDEALYALTADAWVAPSERRL
ncbi:ribosomal-protein-serine acetyltransferase [Deinobacterium chartae]|uniref:Ribosomal-protein-serine acetyltransferase n=1 Tax=Deinobacterium chartae TaxID=521158 RepID=A0A841HWH6_9DEIO|nr:GNAT family protein [Deinobacterium chartae]MBB6097203.1 ribosomal-protein-serine acetyltransferase [Deinobacterium chartae]